jgi:hypothetical protein
MYMFISQKRQINQFEPFKNHDLYLWIDNPMTKHFNGHIHNQGTQNDSL